MGSQAAEECNPGLGRRNCMYNNNNNNNNNMLAYMAPVCQKISEAPACLRLVSSVTFPFIRSNRIELFFRIRSVGDA